MADASGIQHARVRAWASGKRGEIHRHGRVAGRVQSGIQYIRPIWAMKQETIVRLGQ